MEGREEHKKNRRNALVPLLPLLLLLLVLVSLGWGCQYQYSVNCRRSCHYCYTKESVSE